MGAATKQEIEAAIAGLPSELRGTVSRWFEKLGTEYPGSRPADTVVENLTRLVACSDFAAATLLREWSWFVEMQDSIDDVPETDALLRRVAEIKHSVVDIDVVKRELRRFRHRYLLQVLWREIRGIATLGETLTSLSDLADRLLDTAAEYAGRLLQERYGVVRDDSGRCAAIVPHHAVALLQQAPRVFGGRIQ